MTSRKMRFRVERAHSASCLDLILPHSAELLKGFKQGCKRSDLFVFFLRGKSNFSAVRRVKWDESTESEKRSNLRELQWEGRGAGPG